MPFGERESHGGIHNESDESGSGGARARDCALSGSGHWPKFGLWSVVLCCCWVYVCAR